MTSALTSPVVGRLLDRYGSRVMLPVAALITACAMVALSFLGSANGAVIMAVLFAMMGLVDLSAPGALIISVPVLKWFMRERGKAIAYTGLGIPIGALIFVPLTQMIIDWWGWETAWVVLAAIVADVIVPLAAIFVRRQPEDIGLLLTETPRESLPIKLLKSRMGESLNPFQAQTMKFAGQSERQGVLRYSGVW